MKAARELYQQAFESARQAGLEGGAGNAAAVRGIAEYWLGDPAAAKSWSAQSLVVHHEEEVWPAAILALTGETAKAEKLMADQSAKRPKATVLQQIDIPPVRAAIEIKKGNPAAAVEALRVSEAVEGDNLLPTFYRGIAYLSMKSGQEAAAQFKKVIDHKTTMVPSPLHSISRLELARSLALAGDTADARSAYQDLFVVWKDADPDLPSLKQAKSEYAKLR
jgi:eukaryotic-like serine/threonine-protein kinase